MSETDAFGNRRRGHRRRRRRGDDEPAVTTTPVDATRATLDGPIGRTASRRHEPGHTAIHRSPSGVGAPSPGGDG